MVWGWACGTGWAGWADGPGLVSEISGCWMTGSQLDDINVYSILEYDCRENIVVLCSTGHSPSEAPPPSACHWLSLLPPDGEWLKAAGDFLHLAALSW